MPSVLMLAVLARLVLGALSRGARSNPAKVRKGSVPTSVSFAVLVWAVVPLKCVLWTTLVLNGEISALPWLVGGLVVLFPWALVHRALVPLGLWRTAYAVTHLSCWVWRGDTRGGALMAGVWALARGRGRPSPKAIAWLLARREACKPTRGGSILAAALLSEIRDDREGMLALTRSVSLLADDPRHQGARALAAQWLAAEAVARGDWSTAASATRGVQALPPGGRFLAAIARGMTSGLSGRWAYAQLLAAWLLAPHRRKTWALLRRVLAGPPCEPDVQDTDRPGQSNTADPDASDSPEVDPASRGPRAAVDAHARATATDPARLSLQSLAALATLWEAALASPELAQAVHARAVALGARRGDPVATTRRQVTEELAVLVRARPSHAPPIEGAPALLQAAVALVQSAATAEVEARWLPFERRRSSGERMAPVDEWREFIALVEAYTAAVGLRGDTARRLLFDDTDTTVSHVGARLWNDQEERSLSNAMFAWLLQEARAVDDQEAIARLERNTRGGL